MPSNGILGPVICVEHGTVQDPDDEIGKCWTCFAESLDAEPEPDEEDDWWDANGGI